MEQTTNYNLKKPADNENADITDINENMDILDTTIKEISEKANEKELPDTTNDDAGKVLRVNSSGNWEAAEIEIPEITVDTALSSTSTNPVQNKVVKAVLDEKATTATYTATTTADWTDQTGYYTQTVTVAGLLATDNPIIDLVTTTAGFEAEYEAWDKLFKITTATDSITLYASETITTALNLQIKVVR